MKERPIIFSGPMVRAILDGRKTQTRRLITDRLWHVANEIDDDGWPIVEGDDPISVWVRVRCPYGDPGDRLWVRETWACPHGFDLADLLSDGVRPKYKATDNPNSFLWRPSIHMPRWASRITLEITDVRCQWLQDISCADAIAEGAIVSHNSQSIDCDTPDPRHEFRGIWTAVNAKRAPWDSNPLVWVVKFHQIKD